MSGTIVGVALVARANVGLSLRPCACRREWTIRKSDVSSTVAATVLMR